MLRNTDLDIKSALLNTILSQPDIEYPHWIVLLDSIEPEAFHRCSTDYLIRASYYIEPQRTFLCPGCLQTLPLEDIAGKRIPVTGIQVFSP